MDTTTEVMFDKNAEHALLGSLMLDPDVVPSVAQIVNADDFGTLFGKELYTILISLFDQDIPFDTWLIADEAKKLGINIDLAEVIGVTNATSYSGYAVHYATVVQKHSKKRRQVAIANEYAKRIYSGEDPAVTDAWLVGELSSQKVSTNANMSLAASLERQEALIEKWESPQNKEELDRWSWAWGKWNQKIDSPPAGIITLVSAAEGTGKTIVAEVQAEHWAKLGNNVAFFHFELNKDVMITRRMARISGIPYRNLVTNNLTPAQRKRRDAVANYIAQWPGNIEYVSCAGWNIDMIDAECKRLSQQGLCDAFLIDYFQKIQISPRQERRRMDETAYQRDAMERLAILANNEKAPMRGVVLSQLNKTGKNKSAHLVSGADLMGTGALGEKANVSVILHKEALLAGKKGDNGEYIVEPGGFDNKATVKVVKNTLGRTGDMEQYSTSTFDWRDNEN